MTTSRLDWNAPVQFLAGGCAVLFGACALAEMAQAQYVVRPTPPTPPVFNSATRYTVPQPSYMPIAPTTPNVGPGDAISAPVAGLSRITPHRQTSVAKPSSAKTVLRKRGPQRAACTAAAPQRSARRYGCGRACRRAWDGDWFRTSPCS